MATTVTAKKNGKPVEPVKTGRKQTAPGKDETNRAAVRAEAAATDWKSKSAPAPQQQPEDTIVPRGNHPEAAVYVARDKKSGAEVSFDQWGRKLDSLGHVVAGDRQRAGDAGAKEIYRPPVEQKGPPPQPKNGYTIGAGITPNRSGVGPARSSWDNSPLSNRGFPSSSAPVLEPGAQPVSDRPLRPGVLAPGGVDPATGQAFPTAFNGMLTPEMGTMGPQEETAWRTGWGAQNEVRMPWESFAGEYVSPITREPMEAIPGFGMVPTSNIPMDIGGLSMPQIYDPQGPRRDMPVEDPYQGYVPQGGLYDPQGRRRR
jgi:hypothetical protein